ncbi:MAG TPA: hypothetical protein VL096_04645 [Pirellulaceae bacterium]|nr:hypothetical protein [Pirellulaceae bacterium]
MRSSTHWFARGLVGALLCGAMLVSYAVAERGLFRRQIAKPPVAVTAPVVVAASPVIPSPAVGSEPSSTALDEILQIRANEQGAASDPAEAAEFAAALRAVMANKQAEAVVARPVAATPAEAKPASTEPVTALVEKLRSSARHFDQVAADHEDRADFVAADHARDVAQALRQEARQLTKPPAATSY